MSGNPEKDSRPGFHFGAGLGVADAYGDSKEVPYTERFFGGGSRLGRGFAYRGIGPNQFGVPIGGSTPFGVPPRYRMPLYSGVRPRSDPARDAFRRTVFTD